MCKSSAVVFILAVLFQAARTDPPEGYLAICDKEILKETCSLLRGNITKDTAEEALEWASVDMIKDMLSASDVSMTGLWSVLGVPAAIVESTLLERESQVFQDRVGEYGFKILQKDGKADLNIACEKVCYLVRDYIEQHHFLPPASDLACRMEDGGVVCDIDVRPQTLEKLHRTSDVPSSFEGDVEQPDPKSWESKDLKAANASLVQESSEAPRVFDYVPFEIVEGAAKLFRFFPFDRSRDSTPSFSMLETSSRAQGYFDSRRILMLSRRSVAYANLVKRRMELQSTVAPLKEWVGNWGYDGKTAAYRVLNSATYVLEHVTFAWPGPACSSTTLAYAYPLGYRCYGSLGSTLNIRTCRFDAHGNFVIYLCPAFTTRDDGSKVEIMLARSFTHWQAYLQDQCANRYYSKGQPCSNKAWTREQCSALAAFDYPRAMKNPASYAYFVQAVADPSYSERQRCSGRSRALTPFKDQEGDCKCASGSMCYEGGSRTCRNSHGGMDGRWFLSSCTNCRCSVSSSYRCPSSAVSYFPDSDGDCKCPTSASCYTYNSRGCRATTGLQSTRYFLATCAGCACKTGYSTEGVLAPALDALSPTSGDTPLADDGKHDRDIATAGIAPSAPSNEPVPDSHMELLMSTCGAIVILLLVGVALLYRYRKMKKTQGGPADMEFQEAFRSQRQPVRV